MRGERFFVSRTRFSEENQVFTIEQKRLLIEPEHPELSIVRQCELLGLARSSYYYEPVPISEEDLHLMRLLDEQYTKTPFYGQRKMVAHLAEHGYVVDRRRVGGSCNAWGWRRSTPSHT